MKDVVFNALHKPDSCASLLPNPIVYMNEKHRKNPTKLLNIPTLCVTIVKSSVVKSVRVNVHILTAYLSLSSFRKFLAQKNVHFVHILKEYANETSRHVT